MHVHHGSPEDLFERYREAQDLDALAQLFDLAAPELMRLAAHMGPDLASAEDLVQQTFLAAIEKPKAYRAGEPLLAWLFGILANQARKSRRRARRTPEVARLHRPEPEDPSGSAHLHETRQAVHAALERVPEPYRQVLRASLLDEKAPQQIAREFERAPGTVRMQLLRGLELLRRALPAGLAGGGALVLCATRGEAAVKAAVLQRAWAQAALAAGAATSGTSTLALGGLLMSTKTTIAALVALLLCLCGWWLWSQAQQSDLGEFASPAQSVRGQRGAAQASSAPSAELPDSAKTAAQEPGARTEVAAQAASVAGAEAGWWLVGQLLEVRPEHAPEVEFQIRRSGVNGQVLGKADEQGRFAIELGALFGPQPRRGRISGPDFEMEIALPGTELPQGPAQLELSILHPRYISAHETIVANGIPEVLAPGERREIHCEVSLRLAAVASGRVVVPPGWSVEEVEILVQPVDLGAASASQFLLERTSCAADGRYWLKSTQAGERIVYAKHAALVPAAAHCQIVPGELLELPDLVLEEGTCEIEGQVDVPAAWLPVDDAPWPATLSVVALRVGASSSAGVLGAEGGLLIHAANARSFPSLRGGFPLYIQSAVVEPDGRFRLRALEPGTFELVIHGIDAQALMPPREKTIVSAPAAGLVIGGELCRITATVKDASGPVPEALIVFGDGATFESIPVDTQGRAAIVGDVWRDYTVSAHAPGRDQATRELPSAGRMREQELELLLSPAAAAARLVLLPPAQVPVPKSLQVHLHALDDGAGAQPERNETVRLADGRFVLPKVLPGRWKIEVGPSEEQVPVAFFGGYTLPEHFEATLVSGQDCELRLRCAAGGRVRISVESDGAPSPTLACTLVHPDGTRSRPRIVSAESGEGFGVFTAREGWLLLGQQNAIEECLPPGAYELQAQEGGDRLSFEIKAGETTQVRWRLAH